MYRLIRDEIARTLAGFWLTATLGAAASSLMWPVAVINSISDLDNTWLVVKDRSKLAGEVLAGVLCNFAKLNRRPINLVGFSMGARVVFDCLQFLHASGMWDIVNDVVIVGAPISTTLKVPGKKERWDKARAVVTGRFINGYCGGDWLLAFLSRYLEWGISIAGLGPAGVKGVEDIDLSGIVNLHTDYSYKMPEILTFINFYR